MLVAQSADFYVSARGEESGFGIDDNANLRGSLSEVRTVPSLRHRFRVLAPRPGLHPSLRYARIVHADPVSTTKVAPDQSAPPLASLPTGTRIPWPD